MAIKDGGVLITQYISEITGHVIMTYVATGVKSTVLYENVRDRMMRQ